MSCACRCVGPGGVPVVAAVRDGVLPSNLPIVAVPTSTLSVRVNCTAHQERMQGSQAGLKKTLAVPARS